MNEKEIVAEFDRAMTALFGETIPYELMKALKSCVAQLTPKQLNITPDQYIQILRTSTFNLHEAMILLNSFHTQPFGHFQKNGYILEDYEKMYDELVFLVAKWEEVVQPFRQTMNKKMELIKNIGGQNGRISKL